MIAEIVTLIAAAALLFGGMIAMIVALKYRTEKHPQVLSFSPKYWLPLSKAKDWYASKGYRLAFWGGICTSAGAFLGLLRRLI